MKQTISLVAAIVLMAACSKSETPSAVTPAVNVNAETAPVPAMVSPPTAPATPSFDCAKAESEAEQLVCNNSALAALDNRLAAVYAAELAKPGAAKDLAATQRGWVKGRDECWKAEDKQLCVEEAYRTRIAELQINSPGAMAATAIAYKCDDARNPLYMAFYNDYDDRPAVITLGNDQAIIFAQPTGSGAKYGRTGISYWEHQGDVSVDYFGTKLQCTTLPASSNR